MVSYTRKTGKKHYQLRTLIDSKDDTAEAIVGSKDDTIDTVQYEDAKWTNSDLATNTISKILFLGVSQASVNWINVISTSFSKYGVNIGWQGKHAIIYIHRKFESGMEYLEFSKELQDLKIPENFQSTFLKEINTQNKWDYYDKLVNKAFLKKRNKLVSVFSRTDQLAEQLYYFAKSQQMIYGVSQFYYLCLEKFMNN